MDHTPGNGEIELLNCFIESCLSVPLSSKKLVIFMRRGWTRAGAHTVRIYCEDCEEEREKDRERGKLRKQEQMGEIAKCRGGLISVSSLFIDMLSQPHSCHFLQCLL